MVEPDPLIRDSNGLVKLSRTKGASNWIFRFYSVPLVIFFFLCLFCDDVSAGPLPSSAIDEYNASFPLLKRSESHSQKNSPLRIIKIILIPVLVLLSGLFAGLTLGYMSLDETQLHVLAKTGTPSEQKYAQKIIPIRKDGHLLLITLLIANMICNETLPVVTENVLSGIISVIVSTALIVIFSEIIPQSVCSRYGLCIGAHMAWLMRILIVVFFIIAWPIAKLLELILGPHHGVVYRRAGLKELISMHSDQADYGGDLARDTIGIVNATLDSQSKTVVDAMTPMADVFSLDITDHLDYPTMLKILQSGHSRIPVFRNPDAAVLYETISELSSFVDHHEVSLSVNEKAPERKAESKIVPVGVEPELTQTQEMQKQELTNDVPDPSSRFIGCLLTKQLILVDPEEALPLSSIPLNKITVVPEDMLLLDILNVFQEGRSHMAVVCPVLPTPVEKMVTYDAIPEMSSKKRSKHGLLNKLRSIMKPSCGISSQPENDEEKSQQSQPNTSYSQSPVSKQMDTNNPLGIITLEDVLEELIGEEIYDESDRVGPSEPALHPFIPPDAVRAQSKLGRTQDNPTGLTNISPLHIPGNTRKIAKQAYPLSPTSPVVSTDMQESLKTKRPIAAAAVVTSIHSQRLRMQRPHSDRGFIRTTRSDRGVIRGTMNQNP